MLIEFLQLASPTDLICVGNLFIYSKSYLNAFELIKKYAYQCSQVIKVLGKMIFSQKEAKIFCDFLGHFEQMTLKVKSVVVTFWATFGKI